MKKFFKWSSVGLVVIGIVIGGLGLLSGGLDKVDFMYFSELLNN